MLRLYLLLFVIGTIGGGGFIAYKTYTDMQNKIIILSSQNAELKTATAQQEEAVASLLAPLAVATDHPAYTVAAAVFCSPTS